MNSLSGKAAIVTGGAGGMGRAYAHRLADLGADVAILDIDLAVAARYGEQLTHDTVMAEIAARGVRSLGVQVDLARAEAAHAAVEQAAQAFGRIDVVVNNAGGAITDIARSMASIVSAEDTAAVFGANFYATVHVCQAAVPHLKRQGGAVVNIVSTGLDTDSLGGQSAMYRAAKAACLRYSRTLAVELAPNAVRVNCIAPGLIETARIKALSAARNVATSEQAARIPMRRLGTPADVVGTLEFLVSDMSAYVTGECIRVSGGLTLVGL